MLTPMITLITVIFLLYVAIVGIKNNLGHNNPYSIYTQGRSDESTETLFQRIDYGNNIRGTINFQAYNLLFSVIISLLLCFTLKRFDFLFSLIIILFISASMFHSYYEHHIEKFNHFFVDRNLKFLRKRLKLKKVKIRPNDPEESFESHYYQYVLPKT